MLFLLLDTDMLVFCNPAFPTQVVVLALFFHKAAGDPGVAAAGLLSAVMGLVLFLDGLRLSIMPMAMQVGGTPL